MERDIDLKEISDGRLYTANDMVKIDCNDCAGCSECCRVVEDTIILDPYDIFQLESVLNAGFEALMAERLELSVVDGIILPHLKIRDGGEGCTFLSGDGRCMIHGARPGFCRMFPLGRIYENGDFKYFLQVHECGYPNKTKIKVKKWTCLRCPEKNREFVTAWHALIRTAGQKMVEHKQSGRGEKLQELAMYILNEFYVADLPEAAYDDTGITTIYESLCNKIENARESLAHF